MKEKNFLKGILVGVTLSILVSAGGYFLFSQAAIGVRQEKGEQAKPNSRQANQKIEFIEELIKKQYLNEIDEGKLTENMYAGLVNGLGDPYSRYYSKEEYVAETESTEGLYMGIGVVMQQDPETKQAMVVRCYEGAPAAKAGILPGDVISKVDGQKVSSMEIGTISTLIRSKEAGTVKLSIAREGQSDYLEFEVTKEDVEVPTIYSEMLENHVGYIAITEFTEVTAGQYKKAFENLQSQSMEKLVVDLRGNPGGLLTSVCDVLSMVLPKELIVYTEDKDKVRKEYFSEGETALGMPLAVLVNKNSASAAEIFAGAVQDYGVGTLVGTTTFGKGIVQEVIKLTDQSAVKLTTSKYYTPKGRNIHGTGIEPDVKVELDEALKQQISISKEEDNQLQKALEVLGK